MSNDESAKYLNDNSPKPGRFYIIPKIHKLGHPRRSTVSRQQQSPERISQFADHHLQPLVTKLPSYIKDTTRFPNELNNIGKLVNGFLHVTLDVKSLYTKRTEFCKDGILIMTTDLSNSFNNNNLYSAMSEGSLRFTK